MVVHFKSEKFQRIVENSRLRQAKYGKLAENISIRLAELEAVKSLSEISEKPPPKRHRLYGDRTNCWAVYISKNFRIVFKPWGNWKEDDLSSIIEILIVSIEDYH